MPFLDRVRKWVYNIITYKSIETALGITLPDNSLMDERMRKWLDYLLIPFSNKYIHENEFVL